MHSYMIINFDLLSTYTLFQLFNAIVKKLHLPIGSVRQLHDSLSHDQNLIPQGPRQTKPRQIGGGFVGFVRQNNKCSWILIIKVKKQIQIQIISASLLYVKLDIGFVTFVLARR